MGCIRSSKELDGLNFHLRMMVQIKATAPMEPAIATMMMIVLRVNRLVEPLGGGTSADSWAAAAPVTVENVVKVGGGVATTTGGASVTTGLDNVSWITDDWAVLEVREVVGVDEVVGVTDVEVVGASVVEVVVPVPNNVFTTPGMSPPRWVFVVVDTDDAVVVTEVVSVAAAAVTLGEVGAGT